MHAERSKEWRRKNVLSTMPVIARSRHTVVSEWGYGQAGLLKLAKTKSFARHGDLTVASPWPPMQIRIKVDADDV